MPTILDISDPSDNLEGKDNDQDAKTQAVGIDLGTTNSLVCVSNYGVSEVVVDMVGSVVAFNKNGTTVVGIEAEKYQNDQDWIVIKSVKSSMGASKVFEIFGKDYSATQISSIILSHLKLEAEKKLGHQLQKAVITVPAYFDNNQRDETKKAANLAGLEVLRLINEPTAASLAYEIDYHNEGIYAVYDLGGGTFDISILEMKMGVFKVLSTAGDTKLGGDDFDLEIVKNLKVNHTIARQIKEYLSSNDFYTQGSISISREHFESLILPYIHKTIDLFKDALSQAKITPKDLRGIVLVGGSTRIPLIQEAIKYEFDTEIFNNLDPDRIVAFGASIQAENLTRKNIGNLLLDVIPLSLGIEMYGGTAQKIIHRNTTIPFENSQYFTTYEDNQTCIAINVLQGERDLAKDCRQIAALDLNNIPPMPAGLARVKVTFKVDADGILSVTAKEEKFNIESSVTLKPIYGIQHNDVIAMVDESLKYAKEDITQKLLVETRVEALGLIKSIKRQISEYPNILQHSEMEPIILACKKLEEATQGIDRNKIDDEIINLNKIAQKFSSLVIQQMMLESIKNKSIDEVENA